MSVANSGHRMSNGELALGWRVDAIEPTYSVGYMRAWVLGGSIEVEVENGVPIVAWAEFTDHKRKSPGNLLATYHLFESGGGSRLCVWRIGTARPDGRRTAEAEAGTVRRYFRIGDYPPNVTADAVLRELFDAAEERQRDLAEAEELRRAQDPLIDVLDRIKDQVAEDRTGLRALVGELSRGDLEELMVRLAVDYDELGDTLCELENSDDD